MADYMYTVCFYADLLPVAYHQLVLQVSIVIHTSSSVGVHEYGIESEVMPLKITLLTAISSGGSRGGGGGGVESPSPSPPLHQFVPATSYS